MCIQYMNGRISLLNIMTGLKQKGEDKKPLNNDDAKDYVKLIEGT